MKVNKTLALLLGSFILLAFFSSCKSLGSLFGGGEGYISSKTGVRYSSQMEDFEYKVSPYVEQETGPGLQFVEGGSFTIGNPEQDITYSWDAVNRRVTVASFYIDITEIANVDYLEYLHWLKATFGKNSQYKKFYLKALPDTLVWRRPLAYNEPFVQYYLRHPAYQNYPVVGVNWVQANDYSLWRTDRVNEQILIDEKYIEDTRSQASASSIFTTDAYLAGKFNATSQNAGNTEKDRVTMEDGILLPRYRLPTEAEWEYAAYALIGETAQERINNQRIYPWNGHFVRNPNGGERGRFYANFKRGRGDYMGIAGNLNDGYAPTAPVDAFPPNDIGLYNMAGNVNEWVLDVYRPLSYLDFDDYNPFRGNIFTTQVRNKDGSVAGTDSLGHILTRKVGELPKNNTTGLTLKDVKEELKRYNYQAADNRDFQDGDSLSMLGISLDGYDKYMYLNKATKGINPNSLISNETRVYKGGSWRDYPYWMTPGTRRFLDQNRSTDDIGFRCAMIRVGNPSNY